ncbi:hypothetical protein SBV1_810039 [Verrucomicrobia bacterium]|nr:hypothetical protein SBV1_810039 [Verrucomicrobiota bacterium]
MSSDQKRDADDTRARAEEALPAWLRLVRKHVESLKFGTVLITVHESQVTEVVRAEKVRLARSSQSGNEKNQTTGLG